MQGTWGPLNASRCVFKGLRTSACSHVGPISIAWLFWFFEMPPYCRVEKPCRIAYCCIFQEFQRLAYAAGQACVTGHGLCDGSRPVCVWGSRRDVQKFQAKLREAGVTIRMHQAMPMASPRTWAKRQLHRTARVAEIKASFLYTFAYHAGVFGDVQVLLLGAPASPRPRPRPRPRPLRRPQAPLGRLLQRAPLSAPRFALSTIGRSRSPGPTP